MKFKISKDGGELVETENEIVEVESNVFSIKITAKEMECDQISIKPVEDDEL